MNFDPVRFGAAEADIKNLKDAVLRHSNHIGELLTYKNQSTEVISQIEDSFGSRLDAVEKEVKTMSVIVERARGAGWALNVILALVGLIGIGNVFLAYKVIVQGIKVAAQ